MKVWTTAKMKKEVAKEYKESLREAHKEIAMYESLNMKKKRPKYVTSVDYLREMNTINRIA